MFDSHCHLDGEGFATDRALVLERALRAGVGELVVPAVTRASWGPIQQLARRSEAPRCYAAIGLHPVSLVERPAEHDDEDLRALEATLSSADPVAVGECGLDASIDLGLAPWDRQERVLRAQLELARSRSLPVILHARGPQAYRKLAAVLAALGKPVRGVLHSYGGGAHLVSTFLELGLHLGFGGPVTYPNARRVRESVALVPDDRLLAETDAPDQTPASHRPGRNEPAYLCEVIAALASARGQPDARIAALTTANARALFTR